MKQKISIFSFKDYKEYTRQSVQSLAKRGRGEFAKMAAHLRMHPTRLSRIFKGPLQLSPEQACSLCSYWGLSPLESDFFMTMVARSRAGTKELEAILDRQLQQLRDRSKQIVHRVAREKILTSEEKAIFYSAWYYSAIRLAASIEGLQDATTLATFFRMERSKVQEVLNFLLDTGLCIEKDGKIQMGPKTTHLEQSSPLILKHHGNWRLKALTRHEALSGDELAFTSPVSLRKEDFDEIREQLTQVVEKFLKKVTASDPPDTLACLNIDWFKVKS